MENIFIKWKAYRTRKDGHFISMNEEREFILADQRNI